eukprot:2423530-Rhodomonas_salina.2
MAVYLPLIAPPLPKVVLDHPNRLGVRQPLAVHDGLDDAWRRRVRVTWALVSRYWYHVVFGATLLVPRGLWRHAVFGVTLSLSRGH